MKLLREKYQEIILSIFFICTIFVWYKVFWEDQTNLLHIYFFDVGQGDSIFIDSPTHGQALIDGGSSKKVLQELGKVMPFYDKDIDVVFATHPDKDHVGGLVSVLEHYKIGTILEPGSTAQTTIYQELEKQIKDKNINKVLARKGMKIHLGNGADLDILFPDQDVSNWDTNDSSIVVRLHYGESSFLLTGDSPVKIEKYLIEKNQNSLLSTVLKAGHHGSRTSTSIEYVESVNPKYTIISAGKDNSYGHPHKETIDILNNFGTTILSTIDLGTIGFTSDGTNLILK